MINLIGQSEEALQARLEEWQVPAYRVHQIFNWVYHHRIRNFEEMTNLSKDLRRRLANHFYIALPKIAR
ncbi:MAG: 23S rRNA (adenine(2503)-C(2))-methyltransferase RlmN, partial [Nitrospinaceae bacterium]|nr:23S rRNA (adenine(2503)-C(2))-methyltransferase RlmN [Nitrospinaceae bacterium]NIR57662.1 23S rRNA (adenine(2503)-C(2))-methyltransferase RlmN [Nitrospinaceae bacterium]NIS88137.1 23S rRNA (adenine(2503)-C(2))-methyltransferase RlmN [Nitrospinaceae bacterium]NIT85004.1 23S rRNA (adenine(2503)-C(2))-methyltransferase RlmN [Nitrospinaceae bacterium]NIU47173.1 23S rRNA (adenine(2503)-C(2))-methyltransferase RlmN [Nitrospinaceae bacterium]